MSNSTTSVIFAWNLWSVNVTEKMQLKWLIFSRMYFLNKYFSPTKANSESSYFDLPELLIMKNLDYILQLFN